MMYSGNKLILIWHVIFLNFEEGPSIDCVLARIMDLNALTRKYEEF